MNRRATAPPTCWILRLPAVLLAGLALALALAAAPAKAPTKPKPVTGAKPPVAAGAAPKAAAQTPIAVASLASISKLQELANDLGLGEMLAQSPMTVQGIEQGLGPLVGEGGLDPDRPIGLVMFGGGNMAPEQTMAFVLPLKPEATTPQFLKQIGAKFTDKAHPDTGILGADEGGGGTVLRRTKDVLVFGQAPVLNGIKTLDPAAVANPYAEGGEALVRLDVDFAAIRTSMPEQFEQMLAGAAAGAGGDEGAQAGAEAVADMLKTLEKFSIAVDRAGEGGLNLATTIQPLKLSFKTGGAGFQLPTFPEGIVFRADFAFPPAQALINRQQLLDAMAKGAGDELTPAQQKQVTDFANTLIDTFMGGDAASLAVGHAEGKPVAYLVSRRPARKPAAGAAAPPAPATIGDQMKQLVAKWKSIAALTDDPGTAMALSTYTVGGGGGGAVTRLHATGGDEGQGVYIDALQKGDMVYMTFAMDEAKHVEKLSRLKVAGKMAGLAGGYLDLDALVEMLKQMPGSPWEGMPPEQQEQMAALMKDQRIDWSAASGANNAVTFDVTLPGQLLKGLGQLAAMGAAASAPPPETTEEGTPIPEEPGSEEPATEEPATEEPALEVPVEEEPAAEEVTDEPPVEEPEAEESAEEPAVEEPASDDDEPAAEERPAPRKIGARGR